MKRIILMVLLFIGLFLSLSTISGHGVDITDDTMVIANDTNGKLAKSLADENGINISVYKFTSNSEVEHQLQHMLNNPNKRILMVSYQDVGHDFLKKHTELSNRLIILDTVNNNTILDGLKEIMNLNGNVQQNDLGFALPFGLGAIVGLIVGLCGGIWYMKRK